MLLFRVSFTGEWDRDQRAGDFGRRCGSRPCGGPGARHHRIRTETMHVLRAEKATSSSPGHRRHRDADDAGLTWAIGRQSGFVGKRSLERPSMKAAARSSWWVRAPRTRAPSSKKDASAAKPGQSTHGTDRHVTSSTRAACSAIRLPWVVAAGVARLGQTLYVPLPGGDLRSKSPTGFYDPAGARINA